MFCEGGLFEVQHRCLKYLPFYRNLSFLKWVRKILMFYWFQVIVRESALNINLYFFPSDPITKQLFQKTNVPRKFSMALMTMACLELCRKAFGQAFILSLSILSLWITLSRLVLVGINKDYFFHYIPFSIIHIFKKCCSIGINSFSAEAHTVDQMLMSHFYTL